MSVTDDTTTAILDAARTSVLDFGVRRTTLSDVARRAGVSRMTVYRRYPDVRTLLGELMTREFGVLLERVVVETGGEDARRRLRAAVVEVTRALRAHPLFRKVVDAEPELLVPYVVQRIGGTQRLGLRLLQEAIEVGQRDGSIRAGDPHVMAQALLLVQQSFALSAAIEPDVAPERMLDELDRIVDGALAP